MNKPLFPAMIGTCLLLSTALVQAADIVSANCTATDTTAVFSIDDKGAGSLKANIGGEEHSCELQLEQLAGPPFSESMTGMLVMTFDRKHCQNKSTHRRLMREIALHVEEPTGAAASGMSMLQRRPVMYECKLAGFNLTAVRKLVASNPDIKIHSDTP